MSSYEVNGTLYFQTKGDGNGRPWPEMPLKGEYDSNAIWHTGEGVPADLVEGQVIMRIPYFGWGTLILNANRWIVPLLVVLIVLLIAIEFIIPAIKQKAKPRAGLQGGA